MKIARAARRLELLVERYEAVLRGMETMFMQEIPSDQVVTVGPVLHKPPPPLDRGQPPTLREPESFDPDE